MRKLWILLCALPAFGQSYYGTATSPRGLPLPGQTVAVCTQPANTSTTPCSPLATTYTSVALTTPTSTPGLTTTDALGNFHFYVATGLATIQIYGPQVGTPLVQTDVPVPINSAGNNLFTGSNSFAHILGGSGSPLNLPPQGAGSGNDVLQFLQFASAPSTYQDLNHADWYLSRNDSTNNPTCVQGFIGPCDSPLMRVEVTDTQTGRIPGVTGIQIEGDGFAANDNTVANGNFVSMLDAYVRDGAAANVAVLRAANFIAAYRGIPTKTAGGGVTRSVVGLEIDTSNQTGTLTDAVFGGSSSGNQAIGLSINSVGTASDTAAIVIASSNFTSGKGFRHGIEVSGVNGECAFCTFAGGPGIFAPSLTDYFAGSGAPFGFACGIGSLTIPADGQTQRNPSSDCVLFGAISGTNSGSTAAAFRDTLSGGSDFLMFTDLNNNLLLSAGPIGAEATKFLFTPNGVMQFQGSSSGTTNVQSPVAAGSTTQIWPTVSGNIVTTANGTGALIQTKRAVAGCTTAASIGGICASDITVTWGTAFADANYSVSCTGNAPTNVPAGPFIVSGTKLAATVHINYFAITAAAASFASIDCIAQHD